MKRIELPATGETATLTTGAPLLAALRALKVPVLASCGGRGICSTCHVHVCNGMDSLSPKGEREKQTLRLVAESKADSRLACQATVYGDGVQLELPDGLFIEKADDLLSLLGSPAERNILHPITGAILIPKGKRITRTLLEQSRHIDEEVRQLQGGSAASAAPRPKTSFLASGVQYRPPASTFLRASLSDTTIQQSLGGGGTTDTRSTPAPKQLEPKTGVFTSPSARTAVIVPSVRTAPLAPPLNRSNSVSELPVHRDPLPGEQVDHFLLLECVGKGGAGLVFRALNTRLNTLVAIKFLRTDNRSPDALSRLATESQLLARVNHPNVVRVLDFNDSPARPYAVMEFVDGLSLADLIKQSGRLSGNRAVRLTLDVVAGLEAARKLNIVHRDVKPDNILVTRTGEAKLTDFGLAVLSQAGQANRVKGAGTIGYMSPEQATGTGVIDHRTDIYALGISLFQMVTGRLPFEGDNHLEVLIRHAEEPIALVHELVPTLSASLSEVIRFMVAKHPDNRFQDYPELRNALTGLYAPSNEHRILRGEKATQ